MTDKNFELKEIRKGVAMLYSPGDIVELRVPRKHDVEYSANIVGYYYDLDKLANAINDVNKRYKTTVYTMLNPIAPSWMTVNNSVYVGSKAMKDEILERGQELEPRMKKSVMWDSNKTVYSMRMAEDNDIAERRWILIDVDAGQPANTNSSNEEHINTFQMAKKISDYLVEQGIPTPAFSNSGNGHHLYVRINMPNNNASTFLVRRFLKAIAQRFNGQFGTAAVDEGMYNAGRITKAAGSKVFKGADTEERPCRRSEVLRFASKTKIAPTEQIEKIANEYELKPGESLADILNENFIEDKELRSKVEDMKSFLDFYDLDYGPAKQTDTHVIIPCECPNKDEHTMDGGDMECVASVRLSGAYGFCCQHAHCQELRSWKGFRRFMEERTGKKKKPTGVLFLGGKEL